MLKLCHKYLKVQMTKYPNIANNITQQKFCSDDVRRSTDEVDCMIQHLDYPRISASDAAS